MASLADVPLDSDTPSTDAHRAPCLAAVAAAIDRIDTTDWSLRAQADLRSVRRGLDEPIRVAVTGRVNAGKSTIVNALLQQRIAATDVSECTKHVTWFRYGVPERVDVVMIDGTRHPIRLRADGRLPDRLGVELRRQVDLDEDAPIDHLEVYLSNESLRMMTLIDTPGIASVDDDASAATRELLALDRSSRAAATQADVLVFVVAGSLQRDDTDFLRSFQRLFGTLSSSPFSTITVLNKVDQINQESGDPVGDAGDLCDRLSRQLRSTVAGVIPLVGLLAETSQTGALTQADIDGLRRAATADPSAVARALMSVDRYVRSDVMSAEPERRAHLLEVLDLTGTKLALDSLRQGASTSSVVIDRLRGRSGVNTLSRFLGERIVRHADALKAAAAISGIAQTAYRTEKVEQRALLDLLDGLQIAPALHGVRELTLLQRMASGEVTFDPAADGEVRRLFADGTLVERLGVGANSSSADTLAAISARARHWKARANNDAFAGRREAAEIVARSYELLWHRTAEADRTPLVAGSGDGAPWQSPHDESEQQRLPRRQEDLR